MEEGIGRGIADWCGVSEGDPVPIIYLSGSPASAQMTEKFFWDNTGYRFRCLSHAYVGKVNTNNPTKDSYYAKVAKPLLNNPRVRIFYDSGAHSLQNKIYRRGEFSRSFKDKTVKISVEDEIDRYIEGYAKYIKSFHPKCQVDFYVTVDYLINCPTIFKVTQRLYKLGIKPVPVYHGDQSIDWLRRYCDLGHRFFGISVSAATAGTRKLSFYDKVFNFGDRHGLKFHGFMQTSNYLFSYPWWSVDSASWLKAASYGHIIHPGKAVDGRPIFLKFHVSSNSKASSRKSGSAIIGRMPKVSTKDLRDLVESRGHDLDSLSVNLWDRALFNARTFSMVMESGFKPRPTHNMVSLF